MARQNKSRIDFVGKFEKLIADYNAGAMDVDVFFVELVSFVRSMNEEEQRGVAENLTEEELAVFDILTRPAIKLSKAEREQVKIVSKELLDTLKSERLVLDWRKQQKTRALVQSAIRDMLDKLPNLYEKEIYEEKCDLVYQHVYEAYADVRQNFYSAPN
jgi:type I restriction enzyme R subunit